MGRAVLALMCSSILVGCSGRSSSSKSDPPSSGEGTLMVSPSTMNFGNVAVGSSSALTGTLSASNGEVVVSSAAWNGSGYSVSGITFPVTVNAGKTVSYTVTFSPPSVGTSSGSISFTSNASDVALAQSFSGDGTQQAAEQHSVSLSWDPSTSAVIGYNIYRGTRSGGPYSKLNSSLLAGTSYTDAAVQAGATYYYVSTAMSSGHLESSYSDQATAVIP